jgi:hypothetical protein
MTFRHEDIDACLTQAEIERGTDGPHIKLTDRHDERPCRILDDGEIGFATLQANPALAQ